MGSQILIVDDDTLFNNMVCEYLDNEAFIVQSAYDGQEGLEKLTSFSADLIILDVMMPRLNGFDTLRELRKSSETPVLMLTAKGDDMDRVLGLELGADDYLAKPCNLRELTARVKAILRRTKAGKSQQTAPQQKLEFEDLALDIGAQNVWQKGALVAFTSTEFLLLKALVENAGEIVSKDALSQQVLEREFNPLDRSLDVHIGNIRKKLGPKANGLQRIKTARGKGYLYVKEQLAQE